jgi:Zn-dependent protease/CBS domain-containing protein
MADHVEAQGPVTESGGFASGSFSLFRPFGFDVRVHWSWWIVFALLTWSLYNGYFPSVYPNWSPPQRLLTAAITTLLFFASVLAHELSHSIVARRRGLPVEGITLFVFGGVSGLGDEPRSARDEFAIAIVGPITSFVIAALAFLVWLAAYNADVVPVAAVAGYLAYINLTVGIFNLLPGFPLDGGRVLRSIVWGIKGNLLTATRVAATSGKVIAWLLIGLGVLSALSGNIGGLWLVLIGWFLVDAARTSYEQVKLEALLGGVPTSALLEPAASTVAPNATLREFVDRSLLHDQRRAYLVTGPDGALQGLISMSDLQKVPREEWDRTSVAQVMTPRQRLVTVAPSAPALDALRLMAEHDVHQLPVLDGETPMGMITRAGLLGAIHVRSAAGAANRRAA